MGFRGGRVSDLSWVVGDGWLLLVHVVQIIYCISFRFIYPFVVSLISLTAKYFDTLIKVLI